MSTADGRIWAWTMAYRYLEQAQKLRQPRRGSSLIPDPLPQLYWAAMWEAQTWAQLAQTDTATGFLAGDFIQAEIKRLEDEREDRDAVMQRIWEHKEKKDGGKDEETTD